MATYYVSPSGNDSNSGLSTALPWLTLSHASASVTNNDTILHLSGGTWTQQEYYFSQNGITLGVYNGASRWLLDENNQDLGAFAYIVKFDGENCTIEDCEMANTTGDIPSARGLVYTGDGFSASNCFLHDISDTGILRDFSGENATIDGCILEQTVQNNVPNFPGGNPGGGWGAGISAVESAGQTVDGFTCTNCSLFEVGGEGILVAGTEGSTAPSNISDNDLCGAWAVGIYWAGGDDVTRARNMVLGHTAYARYISGTYSGPAITIDSEVSGYELDDIRDYLNLAAFCYGGLYVAQGAAANVSNHNCQHNTVVDCYRSVYVNAPTMSGTNYLRQNASIPITVGTAHDDGTNVPDASDYTKGGNFWSGGGEHANLNDGTDFADNAWAPTKASGWQTIDAFADIAVNDFRPDTQVLGTQYNNPDTGAAFTDYQGSATFREAGALAATGSAGSFTAFQRRQNLGSSFGAHRSGRLGGEVEE